MQVESLFFFFCPKLLKNLLNCHPVIRFAYNTHLSSSATLSLFVCLPTWMSNGNRWIKYVNWIVKKTPHHGCCAILISCVSHFVKSPLTSFSACFSLAVSVWTHDFPWRLKQMTRDLCRCCCRCSYKLFRKRCTVGVCKSLFFSFETHKHNGKCSCYLTRATGKSIIEAKIAFNSLYIWTLLILIVTFFCVHIHLQWVFSIQKAHWTQWREKNWRFYEHSRSQWYESHELQINFQPSVR